MRRVAGIDLGTGFTKAVIVDSDHSVLGRGSVKTSVNLEEAARQAFEAALKEARLSSGSIDYVAATGFGRYNVGFRDIQITEITSGARGAYQLFPDTELVLDIGGQSTRAISLRDQGKVRSFKTNDKCAAGSGSFIIRAAKYLQISVEEAGELALDATNPQPISSVCAVLAESEIINLVSAGVQVQDIVRGIYDSLADRAMMLVKRAGTGNLLTFIGGLATHRGMVKAIEERCDMSLRVPQSCEYVCALGAALLGLRRLAATETQMTVAGANGSFHQRSTQ